MTKFELTFIGGACRYFSETVKRYKRFHATEDAAKAEARRVARILDRDGTAAAHRPIIARA